MTAHLRIAPIELRHANTFVESAHRHHKPVQGHRFSLGCFRGDDMVGVAICGRPVSRMYDQLKVLEVTRLCTDGTKNACSKLYAAVARTAKEMGYVSVQTYTLPCEGGVSLVASGWRNEGEAGGGDWNGKKRTGRRTDQPQEKKYRWRRVLRTNTQESDK